MIAWPVSERVGNVRNNDPQLLEEANPSALPLFPAGRLIRRARTTIPALFCNSCLTIHRFQAFLILFQLHAHSLHPQTGHPPLRSPRS
jgi:hypothetical protein